MPFGPWTWLLALLAVFLPSVFDTLKDSGIFS